MLYIVPTPVGNLEDITLRAIRILKEVDIIFAEDTRVTKKLLSHLGIDKKIYAHHQHNEHKSVGGIIDLLKQGNQVALVSDAGTPGISDPGYLLIRETIKEDINVTCLPGPTAFVPALVNSGIPCDKFVFEGFLPHKKGRQTKINELIDRKITSVFYESPHRILKTLQQFSELFPERQICVAREISKLHEEFKRGEVQEVLAYYEKNPPKGEIVLILAPSN